MPFLSNATSHWPEGRRDSTAEASHWVLLSRRQGWGRAFRPAPRADWLNRRGREERQWGRVPGVHRAAVRGTGGNWEEGYWEPLRRTGGDWEPLGRTGSHWGLLGTVVLSVGGNWEGLGPIGVNWEFGGGELGGTGG